MWPPRQVWSHCVAPSNWKTIKPTLTIYFSFGFFFGFISFAFFLLPPFCCYFLMRALFTSFLLRLQIFKAALSRRERGKWLTFYFFSSAAFTVRKWAVNLILTLLFYLHRHFFTFYPKKTKHFNVSILIKAKNEARWRAEYEVMLVIKILLLISPFPMFLIPEIALLPRENTATTTSKLPKMISYRLHERLMKTFDRLERFFLSCVRAPERLNNLRRLQNVWFTFISMQNGVHG